MFAKVAHLLERRDIYDDTNTQVIQALLYQCVTSGLKHGISWRITKLDLLELPKFLHGSENEFNVGM